ncbi:uncharacterized protein ccdc142 isoform X2 [Sphaeramia orbicularis]|uniref:uncharacterized protein ccdc142 isoform X2 n=1 Tax=Sphaeramia orbicularis TaxID=375764 RepID=UPI0011816D7F|nr:coiled-coil domain-containing protein 142 isoform X2 [Sphaeramia orbicularis]
MDHNNPEKLKDPGAEFGLIADSENLKSVSSEKEQRGSSFCTVTEDPASNGSWSQRSISRSLQRAETLLRSTFNPSLKWLFHSRSLEDCEDQQEEGNFVAACNLVSRSSAPLLRLQQVVVNVAPQWHLLNRTCTGAPQVCVRSVAAEDAFVPLPSFCAIQGHYRALWRLLEKRSLLLFIHEYTRRAHLTETFILRLTQLLEDQMRNSQTLSSWVSFTVDLGSLCQELRVHLNHWSCLSSKIHSDCFLKLALAQQTNVLVDIRQTLDLFSLQALVLMEHYVYTILYAVTQTELDCVPREVLQNILVGTELYNLAVEEQRLQHSTTQLRTMVLQQTHALESNLKNRGRHPAAFSIKELMKILAVHHAERAAKQLHSWNSEQTHYMCQVHIWNEALAHSSKLMSQVDTVDQGASTLRTGKAHWTWDKLLQTFLVTSPPSPVNHQLPTQESSQCPHQETLLKKHHSLPAEPISVKTRNSCLKCQSYGALSGQSQASIKAFDSVQPKLESQISLESFKLTQTLCPSKATSHPVSVFPLPGLCQGQSSVEQLFQLVWSNDLFAPLVCHLPIPEKQLYVTTTEILLPSESADQIISTAAITNPTVSEEMMNILRPDNHHAEKTHQGLAELEKRAEASASSGSGKYKAPETEATVDMEGAGVGMTDHQPQSVQWFDLAQPVVFADLFGQYRSLLWTFCSKALWLQVHVPQGGVSSINLQDSCRRFRSLQRISHVSNTDVVPEECMTMLKGFSLYMLTSIAHAEWDHVMCRSLGSSLKDKCFTDVKRSSTSAASSPTQDGVITSVTMENLLQSLAPVLSVFCHHSSDSSTSAGPFSDFPPRRVFHRRTVSLALATVHLSTVWVMSKAYQFLSSWSLDRFLLITQGDLKALKASLLMTVQQTESLVMNSNSDWDHLSLHNHSQLLLQQQLQALDRTVCELQTLSSTVLKTFSSDCKRMSGEIFEQTMPSAVHWRPSHRTGIPIRQKPSEYASAAAQAVIGQVLEGVAPLSDDARVQALSITMTAFMEAWMEHILKQKIKFSVQGALQLKQDFDSIREMIQSDRYGLSAELLQRLLSLRVFQQVDYALVCLLQQPQSKPYLLSRAWEPFTHCCPTTRQRDVSDAAAGSSVINFRSMDEDMAQSEPSLLTTHVPQVDPSLSGEPYLVPRACISITKCPLSTTVYPGNQHYYHLICQWS